MKKFSTITATCLPLRTENIDTDQIIPARFLKTTTREGIGKFFFYNWRFDKANPRSESIFWDERYKKARILIAGNNFGCGSSREHAVWAILDYGIDVVISSSFGDIFYNNSLKNGLLPVVIPSDILDTLLDITELEPDTPITIDLSNQTLSVPRASVSCNFPIDAFKKACLVNGVDELGYILSREQKIKTFEKKHTSFLRP